MAKLFDPGYPFYHQLENSHCGLGRSIRVSRQNSKTSKEIEEDIFIQVSIFYLQFFIRVFSKDSIVDFAVSPTQYGTWCLVSWEFWEWTFYASRNAHMDFFLQPYPCNYKVLTWKINSWFLQLYTSIPVDTGHKLNVHKTFSLRPVSTGMVNLKLCKSNGVCFNLALHWS